MSTSDTPTGPPPTRKMPPRWPAAVIGALIAVVAATVLITGRSGDTLDAAVAFDSTEPAAEQAVQKIPKGHPADDGFEWPIFGGSPQRTHALAMKRKINAPYKMVWARRGRVLLEFTPVICGRALYLLRNDAVLLKLSRRTGAGMWKRKLGELAASSPACAGESVYVTVLERGRGIKAGRIVALNAETGRTRWSRRLSARTESSPLVFRDRVYFGTEDGAVISLRTSDGAQRWRTPTAGAVKGGITMSDGKLYAADYSGRVYALRRSDGAVRWVRRPSAGGLRLRAGQFYSTPAVAFGRVYVGSTDGGIYSLSTATGKTAWRTGTGRYVYASPAVGSPGGRPTVFAGSYDGRFYALDARTGRKRWTRNLRGRISGSATLVGDTVWVASLGGNRTYALRASDGALRWSTPRGAFQAVVSDGRRIYLNGSTSMFAFDGRGVRFERGRSPVPPKADPVLSKYPQWKRLQILRERRGEAPRHEQTKREQTKPKPGTGSRSGPDATEARRPAAGGLPANEFLRPIGR